MPRRDMTQGEVEDTLVTLHELRYREGIPDPQRAELRNMYEKYDALRIKMDEDHRAFLRAMTDG